MSAAPSIAVVGMACRYPDAGSPQELWQTVLGRRRAFRRLPERRLSDDYRGPRDDADRTYVSHAGLIQGWEFDRHRFSVPGHLHRAVDHTHWIALETAADALADAGFADAQGLDRERVGVILGNSLAGEFTRAAQLRMRWPFLERAATTALREAGVANDRAARAVANFRDLVRRPFPEPGDESLAGGLSNTIAGRICNHFDFHGTGYTVDGACASSLLAIMTACRALATGELDFALAGGVDLSLDPFELVGFARTGALAEGSEMRIFDSAPTGFLPGEGCGVVALMRTDEAERAGVRSYASLVGWGMSSDGAGGLTRPEQSGQVRALHRAYAMAQLGPAAVELVEAHGTGTAVGDRVELAALREMRGADAGQAALGSIKANIGHTKAAAGVAGLMKAALAVHHRVLPPTTGCRTPHELLRLPDSGLRVLADPEPWTTSVPVAAVSSMGFGGINAHVVLRGRPGPPSRKVPAPVRAWSRPLPTADIVLLGADGVGELAARLGQLAERASELSFAELHDLAATEHQTPHGTGMARCGLVADSPAGLACVARAAHQRTQHWDGSVLVDRHAGFVLSAVGHSRVGLLLPGQAAPVRAQLDDWAQELMVPALPDGVRVRDGDTDTAVAQPAIVRQSLAGLAWLTAMGTQPVGAVGHSLGELTALVWAKVLSPAQGLRLAADRGRIMAEFGRHDTTMASLSCGLEPACRLLRGTRVTVAGANTPHQTTVAGSTAEVQLVVEKAVEAGVQARVLPVSHGFHSPAMRPAIEPWHALLREQRFGSVCTPVFSTVTGKVLEPSTDVADLLVRQLTAPVRFIEALTALAGHCDLLIETGPGRILADLAEACALNVPAISMDGEPDSHALATAALATVQAGALKPWFGDRAHRTFHVETPITVLANPCETSLSTPAKVSNETVSNTNERGPLAVLRDYLSRTLELPRTRIQPGSSLLNDLHLSSLQVVQTVAAVSDLLDQPSPPALLPGADTTVASIAAMLAQQPNGAGAVPEACGVRPWVRAFEHQWRPHAPTANADHVQWAVHAPRGHWLHDAVQAPVTGGPVRSGLAVWLDKEDPASVVQVLQMLAEHRPGVLLMLHRGHSAAAAMARSAVAEMKPCAVTVVELPEGMTGIDLSLAADKGYLELRVQPNGAVERLTTLPRPLRGGTVPLGEGDVCLVTGGSNGITARCASALAEHTGCTLVVLGRSPGNAPRVLAGVASLGRRAHYLQCDVTDQRQVRSALATARRIGSLRGLLHGAGVNAPRPMGEVTARTLLETIQPKVRGLHTILADAGDELRLVAAFGSIIGRRGLAGQSEYCIANDWMRRELEQWTPPHCRRRLLEWSVWADLGMAPRMGVLDTLQQQGIAPIQPAVGAQALLAALGDEDAPVTVMLTGRFPASPTLRALGPKFETLRFAESMVAHVGGVEAVLESSLSLGSDPYLAEHRINGTPVLPAVVGLEAMTQAAAVLVGERKSWSFTDVAFRTPVLVDELQARGMRVAALTSDDHEAVEVALRDDTDRYATDRFTATVRTAPAPGARVDVPSPPAQQNVHPFYDSLFFHAGRFRRVVSYDVLSAFRVQAWIRAAPSDPWFAQLHPQRLRLGDLGAHDAAMHALLACIPHRSALPVGVDRLTVWRTPQGCLRVLAEERTHTADRYVFDVDVVDAHGDPIARWEGLHLRAGAPHPWQQPLPVPLIGPLLSRRLIEYRLADDVELTTVTDDDASLVRLSRIASQRQVAIVWSSDSATPYVEPDARLISIITDRARESAAISTLRVRCAQQALASLGTIKDSAMCITDLDDDVVVLRANQVDVMTVKLRTTTAEDPLVVALALERGEPCARTTSRIE
ncbi:SDR family NAD(P)-dependent oxidoreductase [Streptomyces sp. NPDC042319]|uniref:polyketide synthase family protein n=1 Tax=Streptomyces sp. NPDC042319 TaxID=3154332 RepID=UPI0033C2A997